MELATGVPDAARRLAERFWPGALTVVVPRRPGLTVDLGEDEATIGLRCPEHEVPLALCRRVGPLATTSANLHGGETPIAAADVAALFGDALAIVLDGGRCEAARPPSSTHGPHVKLLRRAASLGPT